MATRSRGVAESIEKPPAVAESMPIENPPAVAESMPTEKPLAVVDLNESLGSDVVV